MRTTAIVTLALGALYPFAALAQPASPPPAGSKYVAMGSSFAAGPGITTPDEGTPARCTRSKDNYARQLARRRGLKLTDVSCSGATTAHMAASQQTKNGTNPPQLNFNAGIDGPGCTGGSSPGCGTMLSFIIDNYEGILGQDFTSGGVISTIFFATDLSDPTRGVTGAAGATLLATPIPPAVALFGLGLAGIGLLKRATKKRNAPLGVA